MRLLIYWRYVGNDGASDGRGSGGSTEEQVATAKEELCMFEMSTLQSKNCNDAVAVKSGSIQP
jgi:hypothetical protein